MLMERFLGLAKTQIRSPRTVIHPVPPIESPEQDLEAALSQWASSRECREEFLPYLNKLIGAANDAAHQSFRSHPDVCRALGAEAALRDLKERFDKWAGQAA